MRVTQRVQLFLSVTQLLVNAYVTIMLLVVNVIAVRQDTLAFLVVGNACVILMVHRETPDKETVIVLLEGTMYNTLFVWVDTVFLLL